ncbi:hypothetical protein HQQ80_11315 [Microbacteriaceae bacterium VKM Ac-2855]|nr:hypothetical protein [Microbacteriaceae bacterium VKM Ac-2855]
MSIINPTEVHLTSQYREGRPPDLRPSRWKLWLAIVLAVLGIAVAMIAAVFFVPKPAVLADETAIASAELGSVTAALPADEVLAVDDEQSTLACTAGTARVATVRTLTTTGATDAWADTLADYAGAQGWNISSEQSPTPATITMVTPEGRGYDVRFGDGSVRIATSSLCGAVD